MSFVITLRDECGVELFTREIVSNPRYGRWLAACLNWAERNDVACEPVENDGWCLRIGIRENDKLIFDYIEPLREKARETEDAFQARVDKQLKDVCGNLRRGSIVQRVGKIVAGRSSAQGHRSMLAA